MKIYFYCILFMLSLSFVSSSMNVESSFAGEQQVYTDQDLDQFQGSAGRTYDRSTTHQDYNYEREQDRQERKDYREDDRRERKETREADAKLMKELQKQKSCDAYHEQVAKCKARNGGSISCYSVWDESQACR